MRWPAERGTWVLVGLPWAAGAAAGILSGAWGPSLLLGGALFCGVMAREPLVWSLWRRTHGLPPLPEWRGGAAWAAAGLALTAAWWHLCPQPVHRVALALVLLGAAWEAGMRLIRASAWWPGIGGSALSAAGIFLAAGTAAPEPATWVAAGGIAYAVGCTVCAMGLYTSRVPQARPAARSAPTRLLWGWSAAGGVSLAIAGLTTGALTTSAMVLGMGLLHAEMAHTQPRTRNFRWLGWREALWLATVIALILWAAGRGPAPPP